MAERRMKGLKEQNLKEKKQKMQMQRSRGSGSMTRCIGLLTIWTAVELSLTSFWVSPVVAPFFAPPRATEAWLTPLPFELPLEYTLMVIHASDETSVPVWLLSRLFAWESGWNPNYVSVMNANGTHDLGIAALNDACLLHFERYNDGTAVDPFDPETAMRVASRYLAALYAATGTLRGATAAYNAGLGAYQLGLMPERTRLHVNAIMGRE